MGYGIARISRRRHSHGSVAHRLVTHSTILIVALAVAACEISGTGSSRDTQAEATVCQDLGALVASVGRLSSMDPRTTTVQDVRRSVAPMRGELQALSNAVRGIATDRRTGLQASLDNLDSAVGNIDGHQPVPQALTQIEPELASAAEAFRSYIDSSACEGSQANA